MPAWLHGFAENQPATPVIESVRAFLLDQPLDGRPWAGVLFLRRTR